MSASWMMIITFVLKLLIFTKLSLSRAGRVSQLADEEWQRVLSFVDLRFDPSTPIRMLDRRTFTHYHSDFSVMYRLESIIHRIKHMDDTIDFNEIWNLSKHIQLCGIGEIKMRFINLYLFVINQVLGNKMKNAKSRKLMNAFGFQSISIQEYDELKLDDDRIQFMNITQSGKRKLKLMILASRGMENHDTAVINDSDCGFSTNFNAYDCTKFIQNTAGDPIWIKSNFPWLSAPALQNSHSGHTRTFLLYFHALYEFLWTKYHDEFGFPSYDSLCYISDLDEPELVKKMEFVKYMMDHYRLIILGKFSTTKKKRIRWMERYIMNSQSTDQSDAIKAAMWLNIGETQKSLYWTIAEADRLNKLLMADDPELADEFMTEYVLAISEKGVLAINLRPNHTAFVEAIILRLIGFNGVRDQKSYDRLRVMLGVIRSVKMG